MNKFTFIAQASKSMNAVISEVDASVIYELVKTPFVTVEELANVCELFPELVSKSLQHLISIGMVDQTDDRFVTTCIGDELIEVAADYYIRQVKPEMLLPSPVHKNAAVVTTEMEVMKERAKELLQQKYEVTKIEVVRGNYVIKLKKNAEHVHNVVIRNKGVLRIVGFNFSQEFISKMEAKGMTLTAGYVRGNKRDMYMDIALSKDVLESVLSEM